MHSTEMTMLRAAAPALKTRIEAQHDIIMGLSKENRAIAQEVDVYARAVENLVRENAALQIENAALRAELDALRGHAVTP